MSTVVVVGAGNTGAEIAGLLLQINLDAWAAARAIARELRPRD